MAQSKPPGNVWQKRAHFAADEQRPGERRTLMGSLDDVQIQRFFYKGLSHYSNEICLMI